jgi:EAL domain-containing protein (putative c-di-GMP-specific phosphodiesterase class I)/GGDEF domain-containing protein
VARLLGKDKLFTAAMVFYVVGIILYATLEFFHEKKSHINIIDDRLLQTVSLTVNLLQQELRENISGQEGTLTPDEDFLLSLRLQELADNMHVSDIYSVIENQGNYAFIASTPGLIDIERFQNKAPQMAFLRKFDKAPDALTEAFKTENVTFSLYDSPQGQIRSVFFPFNISYSKNYLIGVNTNIDTLQTVVFASVTKAILYGLFLGLLAFPLILLYLRKLNQNYREEIEANLRNPLTQLPNKRNLQKAIKEDGSDQLLFIEIENFDRLSSTLGVISSDLLILKVAFRLKEFDVEGIEHCRLFHLENNQFAFHTNYDFSEEETKAIISGAYKLLMETNILEDESQGVPLIVRMSAVRHQQNIMMLASMALIHAKETNQALVIYDPSLNLPQYFQKYVEVFNLLTEALRHERVKIYYQPVLDYQESKIIHYEALARIMDQSGNIVSAPDEFMPIAYQSRLCHKLTRVVLDQVIKAIKGTKHVVSINLSVKDLFDAKTRNSIVATIREAGIGHQIEFELQEQQMISQYHLAAAYIRQLRSCNVEIGLDDLGKLYSNFDRLLGLPLSSVKIDGMVVEAIERDSDARSMVEGVVNFASQKGIKVIAKHCHSQSVCDMVATLDVRYMQGFHIGIPVEKIEESGFDHSERKNYG